MKNIPSRCRVCGVTKSQESQMICLFDSAKIIKIKVKLSDMFIACCSSLTLQPNDRLPQFICQICREKLEAAYEFQQQCIKTDREMRAAIFLHDEADSMKISIKQEHQLSTNSNSSFVVEEYLATDQFEEEAEKDDKADIETIIIETVDVKIEDTKHELIADEDEEEDRTYVASDPVSAGSDSEDYVPLKKLVKQKVKKKLGRPLSTKSKTCPICGIECDRPSRLTRHMLVHNEVKRPHKCETCKHGFSSEAKLYRHQLKHTDLFKNIETDELATKYKCAVCDREFDKKLSLAGHLRIHANNKQFNDDDDNENYKKYSCKVCNEKYTDLIEFTKHERTHIKKEIKSFECNLCNLTFGAKGRLVDHLLNHSGLKPYACPYCDKGFQKNHTLTNHIRIHKGETPFLCSICGKSFTSSSTMRHHVKLHSDEKPFACSECPSRFNNKGNLKYHLQRHFGHRPYICHTCGKSFFGNYALKKHIRVHTGEKPYTCELCPKSFRSGFQLTRHKLSHTGEKPHKCKYCERSYAQTGDLRRHLRLHVGDNIYDCPQCTEKFRFHSELQTHIREHFKKDRAAEISLLPTDKETATNTTSTTTLNAIDSIKNE